MREILFRGKRVDNGEWVCSGNIIHFNGGEYYIPVVNSRCTCIHDENDNIIEWNKTMFCKVTPETVGQYTGLVDKNGKKIFEGDIVWGDDVTGTWHKGVIEYDESIGSFIINTQKFTQYRKNENNYDLLGNWNVEGNIHDNPELLEVYNG